MSAPSAPRNHVLDVARAASVVVVVIFHGLLYQIRLEDGHPLVVPWAAPRWLWALSWVFMIIPLFFVAGGFAHALTVDRMRREGTSYGQYLASRGRRLVGPLVVFVSVCALLSTAFALGGWLEQAHEFSRQLMQLLWFITVYLVIVAIAPVMVGLHDRFGVWVLVVLALGAAAVDAWSFAAGDPGIRNLNMLLVWPAVHQLGIAYQRGWIRTGPTWVPWACLAGGASGVAVLVFVACYPPTAVGFADIPIANVQPPTLAMLALAVAQSGVLALVERSGLLASLPPRTARGLALLNALMVSVYLWHIPCIFLAGGLLLAVSLVAPALAPVALFQLTVSGVALVVVALIVPLIARLELRLIPPLGERQNERMAIAAYAVLVVATFLVWQSGTVLHPAYPASTFGVLAVWAGSWLMARAADDSPIGVAGEATP